MFQHSLIAFLIIGLSNATCISSSQCSPVSFLVSASANNILFPSFLGTSNASVIAEFLYSSLANGYTSQETKQVDGVFAVNGTYCRPLVVNRHQHILQLLVHGVTYDSSMWSGFGYSSTYDWQLFASRQGYPTLAVDRLGHGINANYPDPFEIVQGPLQVELLHSLIELLKGGNSRVGQVDGLVYVGHSYGSSLGNNLAERYPEDVDAYILTGFSSNVTISSNDIAYYESAATVDDRFKSLPLGYLTVSTEKARTASFYGGLFDESLAQYDYSREDSVTVGEFLSPGLRPVATTYTRNVLVLNGDRDSLFCAGSPSDCAQILNKTGQDLFPQAAYEYLVISNTGHCLTLHRSAPQTFATAHDWLRHVELPSLMK
ncbi:hypothetical protein TruAng_006956 [Truncatella angustata]|nr:hypothetical protein TruAng_006956 [Truncatella angustata]